MTFRITDEEGLLVPGANNLIRFAIKGPGDIIATDNGDATDMTPFPAIERKAFNGLCLVIVRSQENKHGTIKITAESKGLESAEIYIYSKEEK